MGNHNPELKRIAEMFCIDGVVVSVIPIGNGHINDTYLVTTVRYVRAGRSDHANNNCIERHNDAGLSAKIRKCRYILQRINTHVFQDPAVLMQNVVSVSKHLRGELSYIPCVDGGYYYVESGSAKTKSCWRMMTYIQNAYSCESADDPEIFCEIGRAYGAFISDLDDFPVESLSETIVGFHDTRKRFDDLVRVVEREPASRFMLRRKIQALDEISFALERERYVDILADSVKRGAMPVRVTHNDTKINNVMLDNDTHKAVCVIDLDTVMLGLAVHDFGDAIRSGALTGHEGEKDTDKARFDMKMYRAFERGFLEGFPNITVWEREMLPIGAEVMTLECGIRFLTDYLDGDRYFKTSYPGQNLVRCKAQFRLLREMEDKLL